MSWSLTWERSKEGGQVCGKAVNWFEGDRFLHYEDKDRGRKGSCREMEARGSPCYSESGARGRGKSENLVWDSG